MAKEHNPYGLTSPCNNCPFRRDVKPFINPGRVIEIQRSLVRSDFPCHKTIKHDDEDGHHTPTDKDMHCAGALILMEKLNCPSQMMRTCERIGMYDREKLDMKAPVYDSFEEMLEAHKETERKPCNSPSNKSPTSPAVSVKKRVTRRRK